MGPVATPVHTYHRVRHGLPATNRGRLGSIPGVPMRILLTAQIETEAGNRALKDGSLATIIEDFARAHHPEAMYFTTEDGRRTAFIVVDMPDSSYLPAMAEPFFTKLNARISGRPVMNVDDLKTGMARLKG